MKKKGKGKKSRARKIREQGAKKIAGWSREDFHELASGDNAIIVPACERHPFDDELRRLRSGTLRGHAI